jgi:hypothetical protein
MAANNSVPTAGMAAQSSSPIDRLPTDLLYEIIPHLTTSELRLLGRVNRGLYDFFAAYLRSERYAAPIFRLPKNVLEDIAIYLPSRKDDSRLARASQKFYLNLMESMVRIEMNGQENDLRYHAAKHNNTGLAAKLLHMGTDVDGRVNRYLIYPTLYNPLLAAARYGQENMVLLLLKAGANDIMRAGKGVGEGIQYPL